jgi:hypothetical protein
LVAAGVGEAGVLAVAGAGADDAGTGADAAALGDGAALPDLGFELVHAGASIRLAAVVTAARVRLRMAISSG